MCAKVRLHTHGCDVQQYVALCVYECVAVGAAAAAAAACRSISTKVAGASCARIDVRKRGVSTRHTFKISQ